METALLASPIRIDYPELPSEAESDTSGKLTSDVPWQCHPIESTESCSASLPIGKVADSPLEDLKSSQPKRRRIYRHIYQEYEDECLTGDASSLAEGTAASVDGSFDSSMDMADGTESVDSLNEQDPDNDERIDDDLIPAPFEVAEPSNTIQSARSTSPGSDDESIMSDEDRFDYLATTPRRVSAYSGNVRAHHNLLGKIRRLQGIYASSSSLYTKKTQSRGRHPLAKYGNVRDIQVGTMWPSRKDCCNRGVHGATRAGIHGVKGGPAYSVCLDGGYEDNDDNGETFVYCGTGPKGSDQTFEHRHNASLEWSVIRGTPVRVVRGPKCGSRYAPAIGFRYDGLYKVESAELKPGLGGNLVCKFEFTRLEGQPPLPTLY